MVAPEVQGIDLFKIASRSISGWIRATKRAQSQAAVCSQLEERLLLWLEYHPLVASYARGDIDPQFATKYRLPIPNMPHSPLATRLSVFFGRGISISQPSTSTSWWDSRWLAANLSIALTAASRACCNCGG